jgi:hypothetical protein
MSNKEMFIKKAERHEELAKQLRGLASGKYIDDEGNEFAKVDSGKLTFTGKAPKLDSTEFARFSAWLKKVASV